VADTFDVKSKPIIILMRAAAQAVGKASLSEALESLRSNGYIESFEIRSGYIRVHTKLQTRFELAQMVTESFDRFADATTHSSFKK
jgi:hypothetical protein